MSTTRGFFRRRSGDDERLPPGQYLENGFPVLSAGPTPHTPLEQWDFSITGAISQERSWTWEQFLALPTEDITVDIHCVTTWTKLDTQWTGVSVDTLLVGVELEGGYVTALLGLMLMRGGFVPGLSDLDSSAQILAWAIIFGYAQEVFTRLVDSQAHAVLDDVGQTSPTARAEVTAAG